MCSVAVGVMLNGSVCCYVVRMVLFCTSTNLEELVNNDVGMYVFMT